MRIASDMKNLVKILLLLLLFSCNKKDQITILAPVDLTCEYVQNPSVVDVTQPRLAWINSAPEGVRGQEQTAFQIRVASTLDKLLEPDLWDSDKVISSQSNRVEYAGKKPKITAGLLVAGSGLGQR